MLHEININNERIFTIHYRKLINNFVFNLGEISIGEYNIDKVTENINEEFSYYAKRIFLKLFSHIIAIIYGNVYRDTVYCFSIKQHDPFQKPHDIQLINKDIEIEVDPDTSIITIGNLLKDRIDNMPDDRFSLDEDIKTGVTLTVVKIEKLKEWKDSQKSIKINLSTFKDDVCVICIETKPNVLFCNCGHLIICESCYDKLENNKCPKCREFNKTIRIL